ncbi:lactate racemase domain-containing protein [Clostridium sp. KNHs216]|uniref:lactate racemase domain-containing protein n=1 Tax=Clostridium sp. KNHs216 TaxID=1550235 RepID=UPI001153CA9B|nr:lactate racemase domain-containing protein [Clostridium sp. KNHs216]TQI68325.1 uncharacterized protein DUF2088 [Clostridium sp. KNHs216]
MKIVSTLAQQVDLPEMIKVRQRFPDSRLEPERIPDVLGQEFVRSGIGSKIKPGEKIAITAGSRGIKNIDLILKTIVKLIRERQACPVIVAAMGSHGGAVSAGQQNILDSLNLTEKSLGCSVVCGTETICIGETPDGKEVFLSKTAAESDGILIVNRIKPHTSFRGKYESGLMKMMAIGLAQQKGAEACHRDGFGGMAYNVESFGKTVLKCTNVIGGIGIIENAMEDTCELHAFTPQEIVELEPVYLEKAKALMPKIYFDPLDVLIVDRVGKNISGDGMDPNITGTFGTSFATGGVTAQRVVALDLTDETHGSAVGIGMAHAITQRLFRKIDMEQTYPNLITTKVLEQGRLPMVFASDQEAIQIALRCCVNYDINNPRIVRIGNTRDIEEIYISPALLPEAQEHPMVEILNGPQKFSFDSAGNLW